MKKVPNRPRRGEVEITRLDGRRQRYVLARTFTAELAPRRGPRQFSEPSPREPRLPGIIDPLPTRVQTILYHRLEPEEQACLNGAADLLDGHLPTNRAALNPLRKK